VNPRLTDVVAALDSLYDPSWAADWDAVGTVCGDPDVEVARVLWAVDPVEAVVREAVEWDADLVVTHHPLLLRPVHGVAATSPKGRIVHSLIRHGIALHTCHTNADSPPGGVSEALAGALGLLDVRPLDPEPGSHLDKLVTYVPHAHAERMIDALAAAGAGAVGDYERCAFTSTGVGTFRPLPGADPAIGSIGEVEHVGETRIEMVLQRSLRRSVIEVLLAAHPYEEPAYDVLEMAPVPGDRGHGRVGRLAQARSLLDFATDVVAALPGTASAVRVAGQPDRSVETVAVCGGAGDFLLDLVRTSGVDAYVTSDLRHHPVSEVTEHAAAPALVDVPHWAGEWTWLPVAAERLTRRLAQAGTTVETRVSATVTDPWSLHLPMT
jgi:dinuclear metal center YbgI/SA1388 family protein